jgi:hypothetical protein
VGEGVGVGVGEGVGTLRQVGMLKGLLQRVLGWCMWCRQWLGLGHWLPSGLRRPGRRCLLATVPLTVAPSTTLHAITNAADICLSLLGSLRGGGWRPTPTATSTSTSPTTAPKGAHHITKATAQG